MLWPGFGATFTKSNHTLKDVYVYKQKGQNQENWSRKSQDMFYLLRWVKPVLHLPYLKDPNLTLKTQFWKPGEFYSSRITLQHPKKYQTILDLADP